MEPQYQWHKPNILLLFGPGLMYRLSDGRHHQFSKQASSTASSKNNNVLWQNLSTSVAQQKRLAGTSDCMLQPRKASPSEASSSIASEFAAASTHSRWTSSITPATTWESEASTSRLQPSVIAGIVVGVVAICRMILGVIFYYSFRPWIKGRGKAAEAPVQFLTYETYSQPQHSISSQTISDTTYHTPDTSSSTPCKSPCSPNALGEGIISPSSTHHQVPGPIEKDSDAVYELSNDPRSREDFATLPQWSCCSLPTSVLQFSQGSYKLFCAVVARAYDAVSSLKWSRLWNTKKVIWRLLWLLNLLQEEPSAAWQQKLNRDNSLDKIWDEERVIAIPSSIGYQVREQCRALFIWRQQRDSDSYTFCSLFCYVLRMSERRVETYDLVSRWSDQYKWSSCLKIAIC